MQSGWRPDRLRNRVMLMRGGVRPVLPPSAGPGNPLEFPTTRTHPAALSCNTRREILWLDIDTFPFHVDIIDSVEGGMWLIIQVLSYVSDLLGNDKLLMKFRRWNRSSVHHTNDIIHNGNIFRVTRGLKMRESNTTHQQRQNNGDGMGTSLTRSTRRNTNETCPFSEFKHQESASSIWPPNSHFPLRLFSSLFVKFINKSHLSNWMQSWTYRRAVNVIKNSIKSKEIAECWERETEIDGRRRMAIRFRRRTSVWRCDHNTRDTGGKSFRRHHRR